MERGSAKSSAVEHVGQTTVSIASVAAQADTPTPPIEGGYLTLQPEEGGPLDGDLRTLIDDPRFREYHRAHLQREFNTFDVLRYADYEIRHSNVLAWLLRPADTHGIGERFLEWFVNHVNERRAAEKPSPRKVLGCQL